MKFISSIRYAMLLAAAVLLWTATVHVQSEGIRLTNPRPRTDLRICPGTCARFRSRDPPTWTSSSRTSRPRGHWARRCSGTCRWAATASRRARAAISAPAPTRARRTRSVPALKHRAGGRLRRTRLAAVPTRSCADRLSADRLAIPGVRGALDRRPTATMPCHLRACIILAYGPIRRASALVRVNTAASSRATRRR